MKEITPGMQKIIEKDFEKALKEKAKLKGVKDDMPSLIEFYRAEMGIPESHYPIEQIQTETFDSGGSEARASAQYHQRLGPLTTGLIKLGKGQGIGVVVHELKHAKEHKAQSKPEYEYLKSGRELLNMHFRDSRMGDPLGVGWELEETLKLEKEIEDLKRVIEGLKKK